MQNIKQEKQSFLIFILLNTHINHPFPLSFFVFFLSEKLSLRPVGCKYKPKVADRYFVNWWKKPNKLQKTPQAGLLSDSKFQSLQDLFEKQLQNNQPWKINQYPFTYSESERSWHRNSFRPGIQPYHLAGHLGFWHANILVAAGFSCYLLQCKSEQQVPLPPHYLKEVIGCPKPKAGDQSKVVCQIVFLSQMRVSAY